MPLRRQLQTASGITLRIIKRIPQKRAEKVCRYAERKPDRGKSGTDLSPEVIRQRRIIPDTHPHPAVDNTADSQFQTCNAKASGQTAQQPSGRFPFFSDPVHNTHCKSACERHCPVRRAAKHDFQQVVHKSSAKKHCCKFRCSVHAITLGLSCGNMSVFILFPCLERSSNGIKKVTICRIN